MARYRKAQRWQRVTAISMLGLATIAAMGQSPTMNHNVFTDGDYRAPYDHSKGDKALQDFDKLHPECAMWTDWHKLCQRLGSNGKTFCEVDPTYPARPSVPFCARATGYSLFVLGDGPANETPAERASRLRFKKSVTRHPNQRHLSYDHVENYTQTNVVWKEHRPFNGRAPFGFDYPECKLWTYQRPSGVEIKCATDGRTDIAPCPNANKVSLSQPKCIEIAERSVCNPKLDANDLENYANINPDRIVPYMDGWGPTAFPVHGFKCPWVE